jgi:hypothetical protein
MNAVHVSAADLIAQGSMSITEIAAKVGIGRWTLWMWGRRPEFAQVVRERREVYRAEVYSHGVALTEQRIAAAQDRWRRMRELIEARAATMADVPGGSTGLLMRRQRGVGEGQNFKLIEWFEADVGLLREIRNLEEHVARELGQWISQSETTSRREVEVEATTMATSELLERARAILRAAGELPAAQPEVPAGDPCRGQP